MTHNRRNNRQFLLFSTFIIFIQIQRNRNTFQSKRHQNNQKDKYHFIQNASLQMFEETISSFCDNLNTKGICSSFNIKEKSISIHFCFSLSFFSLFQENHQQEELIIVIISKTKRNKHKMNLYSIIIYNDIIML